MSPRLASALDIARTLAWLPVGNLIGVRYHERLELHVALRERLRRADGRRSGIRLRHASPELLEVVAAMRRVAAASFANRRGEPYYIRRQAIIELRGCLLVYDRSVAA